MMGCVGKWLSYVLSDHPAASLRGPFDERLGTDRAHVKGGTLHVEEISGLSLTPQSENTPAAPSGA